MLELVNIENFNTTILDAYAMGEDDDLEADLDTARSELCGSSDGVTGEFYGGDSTTSNDRMDSIEKITIASTGNGSDVGDLLEVNELAGATSGR